MLIQILYIYIYYIYEFILVDNVFLLGFNFKMNCLI